MKTQDIVNAIYQDFTTKYRGATNFVDSGDIWDFCIETIKDPVLMSNLAFANDLDIPPVKALLLIYERKVKPSDTFEFNTQESRCIGALMGFVFKFVLGYKEQKERCKVGKYGIKEATRFLKGPVVEFTD